jgi:hypothetical protein
MTLILPAVALACFVLVLYRSLAFGRKRELTMAEQREKAFGKAKPGYRYTYAGRPHRRRLFTRIRRSA